MGISVAHQLFGPYISPAIAMNSQAPAIAEANPKITLIWLSDIA